MTTRCRVNWWAVFVPVLWAGPGGGDARAALIVAPNGFAASEGNDGLSFIGQSTGARLQQVYAASQFAALGGPQAVTHIAFRPNGGAATFALTIPSIQVNLSTTRAAPDALSATYAANVGPDDTAVYSGALTLATAAPPGLARDFDLVIALQTPFVYDPAAGNLLVDFRVLTGSGGATFFFDSHTVVGDPVSRVSGFGFETGFTNTDGYVTRFQFGPVAGVPEPASAALLGLGAAGLVVGRARRRPWYPGTLARPSRLGEMP